MKKRRNKQQTGLSWSAFRDEWLSWWTAKAPVLFFGAKFGALIVLLYALLAFPGPWKRKLAGMLAGIVALQALNLVRIVSLYMLGSRYPSMFAPMHLEVWPAFFIVVAIALFVGWKGWALEE